MMISSAIFFHFFKMLIFLGFTDGGGMVGGEGRAGVKKMINKIFGKQL